MATEGVVDFNSNVKVVFEGSGERQCNEGATLSFWVTKLSSNFFLFF